MKAIQRITGYYRTKNQKTLYLRTLKCYGPLLPFMTVPESSIYD